MSSQERITVYNLAGTLYDLYVPRSHIKYCSHEPQLTSLPETDLKNTSDDAIPNYLNSLKFKQDHRLLDTHLALGYAAFAIAAACFLWDYKFGFESTKWYTAGAVVLYSLINSALTLWVSFVEKNIVYQGTAPDGTKVSAQIQVFSLEAVASNGLTARNPNQTDFCLDLDQEKRAHLPRRRRHYTEEGRH
jgi:hypothetical protein